MLDYPFSSNLKVTLDFAVFQLSFFSFLFFFFVAGREVLSAGRVKAVNQRRRHCQPRPERRAELESTGELDLRNGRGCGPQKPTQRRA